MAKAKKGTKENPLKIGELANINQRSFIINEAIIKDDFCNYMYEVTNGVGIGDKHSVGSTGIIDDDMRTAFAKFHVHLAAMDEVFKHSGIEVVDIDALHSHELTMLYRVKSFKIKKSKGYESISLKAEKYVSSAGGWMGLITPEVPLDSLSSYAWHAQLKEVSDQAREEVALYREGKYTAKEDDEPEEKTQAGLFDLSGDLETADELENAKMD